MNLFAKRYYLCFKIGSREDNVSLVNLELILCNVLGVRMIR